MNVNDFSHKILGKVKGMCFSRDNESLHICTDKGCYCFGIEVADSFVFSKLYKESSFSVDKKKVVCSE